MSVNHEHLPDLIHGHFGRGLRPAKEALLRAHLAGCAECRESYQAHQIAEQLDPAGPSPGERLARSLGLRAKRAGAPRWGRIWAVAGVAVASAVVLTVSAGSHRRNDGVSARGAAVTHTESVDLAIFRIDGQGESARVTNAIAAGDELAFAYRNEVGKTFLMIFAVDGRDRVLWYHPAWTRAEDNPLAVAITKQVGLKELPEAVRHPLQSSALTVYALFMDRPLDVRTVEGRVAGGVFSAHPESGEILRVLPLTVKP
jgi:hypothetical protein